MTEPSRSAGTALEGLFNAHVFRAILRLDAEVIYSRTVVEKSISKV